MKKITIVILHFGKVAITQECINSLEKNETYPYELFVVNNTKEDFSAKYFSKKHITVINNKTNKGFAGGVNVGIKKSLAQKADAILLLNNDTKIGKPFIKGLTDILFEKKDIGVVGPAIAFTNYGKKIFDIGGNITWFGKTFHEEVTSLKDQNPHEVAYVTGAAMLIKKEVFQKIGLFDENYFLYYEDIDFCLRARGKGFKVFNIPSAVISHALSRTAGKVSPFAVYHQTKSAVIFEKKHMKSLFEKFMHFLFLFSQSGLITLKKPRSGIAAWKAFLTTSKIFQTVFYVLLLILLTLASYWKIFSFTFWKDDWSLLWSTLYNLKGYHGYFNHPGTPIEFLLLTPIFKTNPIYWMSFGIVLRIVNAFFVGIFAKKLTRSNTIGFLSGIFFAASYAGGESLHFISAQVTELALIPLCITGIYFIKVLEEKKTYLYAFLFWLLVTFLVDPPRTVPIIFLLPIIAVLKKEGKNYRFVLGILKKFYFVFILLGVPLFIFWFIFLSPGTLLAKLFAQIPKHPQVIFQKYYELHHLAATIGNLFIGWIYRMVQDDQNTGIYSRFFAVVGYLIGLVGMGSLLVFFKTKRNLFGIISFTILWAFLFYLPNFLSEPRAPMAAPHRYLLIPSIGLVVLLAYIIVQIRRKTLIVLLSLVFLLLNIYQSNTVLSYQATYRSTQVVEKIWNSMSKSVPSGQEYDSIWMVSGKEPWVSEDVLLNGFAPMALQRHLIDSDSFPMMTNYMNVAVKFLCNDKLPQINRWNIVLQKNRIHLSHVYAWKIEDNGSVTDISQQRRVELEKLAQQEKCTPIQ